ncbi:hypothetical protein EIN_397050 [Entamoeba invadens IP1]|uniref:Uncharacterized protein n=1 Tax=Entamoeba invadens IP1 TaxID=370355 RepID=A0A0A1UA37_ENTIV|nr:hypothetical protein EIN_397050 [Entamoeba invadens IP1]ELP91845.1 hypothetical protein EIN_397050 [Entamoeba invadens IP1]|eukprot:XP_004258616.1 hypothetical protein EIN_397050 [Entamoeba invadens IP1]
MNSQLPNYKLLIDSCEAYSKSQLHFAQCSSTLAAALKTMCPTVEGCNEINTAIQNVAGMIEADANSIKQSNEVFTDNTTRVFRGEVNELPKKIKEMKDSIKTDRKKSEESKEKATKKAKNLKKGDNLKTLMENINECEKVVQKGIVKGLTDTTNLMCEMYCQIITGMFVFLEQQQTSSSLITQFLEKNTPKIKKLSKTQNVWPRRVKDLIINKKQILINTKWLSDDLKQILKDAGVKRKDLADPDTVQMLFAIITEQVQAGNIPAEILGELQRKDDAPEVHSISLTPRVDSGAENTDITPPPIPPSPRSGPKPNGAPPKPSSRPNGAPPKPAPRRGTGAAKMVAPPADLLAPPPGLAPPPLAPPPGGAGAPPPPPPRGSPAGGSMLEQLGKAQLKKVDMNAPRPSVANLNKTQKVDLTSLLANAMQKRREDIADDSDDNDSEESDEWDD